MADQEQEVPADSAEATGGGDANSDPLVLKESTRDTMLQDPAEILQGTSSQSELAAEERLRDDVTSPHEDGQLNRGVANRPEEAAHGNELPVAHADRARRVELEIANQEALLDRLRKKHEGKPGRWK